MKKLFEGILRFAVGVFAFFAPVLIIMFLYTGLTDQRYWQVVFGVAAAVLLYKASQWLDWL